MHVSGKIWSDGSFLHKLKLENNIANRFILRIPVESQYSLTATALLAWRAQDWQRDTQSASPFEQSLWKLNKIVKQLCREQTTI